MLEETNIETDMKGHAATYSSVIGLLKWGAIACAVIVLGVILLIAR